MEKNPEPELVTMRCPCDDPNPCCSEVITSPKGLISVLFWDCKGFTEEEKDEEFDQLRTILTASFEDEDE